jgi:hypothetical protein
MPMSADYLKITVGREPLFPGEGQCTDCHFYFSQSALDKIKRDGPRWKYRKYALVPEAIGNPLVIFEDLRREEYTDGFCYVAKPVDGDSASPASKGYLFLVFVKKEFGLVVFEWDWRRESGRSGFPENWRNDFGRVAWQKT